MKEKYEDLKNELIQTLSHFYSHSPIGQLDSILEGEGSVLLYLYNRKEEVNPSEISEALGITKARVTAISNALYEKEFILFHKNEKDKRKINLMLNPLGEAMITHKLEMLDKRIISILEDLGIEKTEMLIDILNEIQKIITRE